MPCKKDRDGYGNCGSDGGQPDGGAQSLVKQRHGIGSNIVLQRPSFRERWVAELEAVDDEADNWDQNQKQKKANDRYQDRVILDAAPRQLEPGPSTGLDHYLRLHLSTLPAGAYLRHKLMGFRRYFR